MHTDNAGATIADIAVFDGGPYPASAVAEDDARVLFIGRETVHELCARTPAFALVALKLMAERVRRHAQLIHILTFHEVGQRLALFLLAESEGLSAGQAGPITFRLKQSNHEIASRIGSVRDVVSRALARLQSLGLVAVKARVVTIANEGALRAYAMSSAKAAVSAGGCDN